MPEELTTEYTMENWREATKDWTFLPYSIGGYGEPQGTVYIGDASAYGRSDFESALKKVSRKRNLPVGEHIREAIQTIKGNND
jgi:hypothetical protein